jgi:regulator of protease activity HflC (stomatin/prohibitin superfamily)
MENFLIKLLEWLWDKAERFILPYMIVRDYEAGVVLLLGKYHFTMKKGFNWKWPLIHESLTCLIKPETLELRPMTLQLKGNNMISITMVGGYEVKDEKKFLLEANDAASNIPHHFMTVSSDYITEASFEELIEKTTPYTNIKNKLNKKVEYLGVEFFMVGYGSICKTRPISLINH